MIICVEHKKTTLIVKEAVKYYIYLFNVGSMEESILSFR